LGHTIGESSLMLAWEIFPRQQNGTRKRA